MSVSPLARAVLDHHLQAPNDEFFDLAVFGSMFREHDLDRLRTAYRELTAAGLVEQTERTERFFDHHVPLYRLTRANRVAPEAA